MQLPEWVSLVTELTQHGYIELVFVELACPAHGDWRGAVADIAGNVLTCPKCQQPAEAAILGRGLTRRPEIEWKCISPALPEAWKIDRTEGESNSRYARVASRKRCEKFFARARAELARIR